MEGTYGFLVPMSKEHCRGRLLETRGCEEFASHSPRELALIADQIGCLNTPERHVY